MGRAGPNAEEGFWFHPPNAFLWTFVCKSIAPKTRGKIVPRERKRRAHARV
jgi:hypothetical protein